jgi:hypothetical protein
MRNNVRKLLLLLVCCLVAACQPMTVQRDEDGPVPVTLRVDDAAYWIEEWYRVTMAPGAQVEQTLATREKEFARHKDTRNRLRLALLLAEGPPAVRDQGRALSLLNGLDQAHASASAQALAALLSQVVREQAAASDKIAVQKQDLQQTRDRVKELEQQLQELTDIEQSIRQRETPVEQKEK